MWLTYLQETLRQQLNSTGTSKYSIFILFCCPPCTQISIYLFCIHKFVTIFCFSFSWKDLYPYKWKKILCFKIYANCKSCYFLITLVSTPPLYMWWKRVIIILFLQIHIREAKDLCCALGMKLAEMYSSTDVTDLVTIIAKSANI